MGPGDEAPLARIGEDALELDRDPLLLLVLRRLAAGMVGD